MSWLEFAPLYVSALAALLVPGFILLRSMSISTLTSVQAAPLMSFALFLGGGAACHVLDVPWMRATSLVSVVLCGVGIWFVGRWSRPGSRAAGVVAKESSRVPSADSRMLPTVLLVLVSTSGIGLWILATAAGSPLAIPQVPDTAFHLGAPSLMVQSQSGFVLDAGRLMGAPGTYPGGFHVVVDTIMTWTGAPVTAVAHALVAVLIGWVWPSGMGLLARVSLRQSPWVLASAALVAMLFTEFPFRYLQSGVLWANLTGYALAPTLTAVLVSLLRGEQDSRAEFAGTRSTLVLAFIGLGVVAVAHPNAVFAVGIFITAFLAVSSQLVCRLGGITQRRRVVPLTVALAAVLVVTAVWIIAPAGMRLVNADVPPRALRNVILDRLLGLTGVGTAGNVTLVALVSLGAWSMLRHRRTRWVPLAAAPLVVLFVLSARLNSDWVRRLTWPWWNDQYRLKSALVIPLVLCAVSGLGLIAGATSRMARRLSRGTAWQGGDRIVLLIACLAAALGSAPAHANLISPTYAVDPPEDTFITSAESEALARLASAIPPRAVTATSPWNGANFLTSIASRRLVYFPNAVPQERDQAVLAQHLADIRSNPDACRAAKNLRVEFVVTGGNPPAWAGATASDMYAGIARVDADQGFIPIASEHPYTLWSLPDCSSS